MIQRLLVIALAMTVACQGLPAQEPVPVAFSIAPGPTVALPDGVGPTAGAWVGDRWAVATPTAWWSRTPTATTWTAEGVAGLGRTHAAGARDGEGWILVGGRDAQGQVSKAVTRLSLNGSTLAADTLPDLPEARALAGAAVLDRHLYVVGGLDGAGRPVDQVYRLALATPGAAWSLLDRPLPSGPRILPSVVGQFGFLLVAGGRTQGPTGWTADTSAWAWRERPQDGLTATGWIKRTPLPTALSGAFGVGSATAHMTLYGGDATPVIDDPWAKPTGPGAKPLVYHGITDAWFPVDATVPAGAIATRERVLDPATGWEAPISRSVTTYSLHWVDYLAVLGYFVLMTWIGVKCSSNNKTSSSFSLGNRKVSWWSAGISMFATGASSISFIAIPAQAFASNLVWFTPVLMMIVSYFVGAYIIYPLLRKLELTSTFEFLSRRFHPSLRLLASAQCIIMQSVGRMSVIMVLPAMAISAFTGIDVSLSVLLMGVLTTIYTTIGGFSAAIWTSVFEGALSLIAPAVIIIICITDLPGGAPQFVDIASNYEKFSMAIFTWDIAVPCLWMMIYGAFINMAGAVGDQPVIQRIFSVPMHEVRRTTLIFNICGVTIAALVFTMGLCLFAFYHASPERLPPTIANDQIVPWFIVQNLPIGLVGLVLAALFAGAMSTLSSTMNSVATLVSEDFYKPWRKAVTDREILIVLRTVTYSVGALGTTIAVIMANMDISSMFAVWNKIVALLGGGFVGIYILGIFTTRANTTGAWAGGIASVAVTVFLNELGTVVHYIHFGPIATTSCVVVGYVVSLCTGGNRKDLTGLTFLTPSKG